MLELKLIHVSKRGPCGVYHMYLLCIVVETVIYKTLYVERITNHHLVISCK